jgi:hypothetical protein
MSKPTIGQSHTVIQTLATNTNWEVLDHAILQKIVDDPTEAGKQFTAFLKNGGKVIVDGSKIINIDRSQPFDPATFIGSGWSIVEQDERAVALNEIDLTEVMFDTTLEKGEKSIKGENKLNRLKEKGRIRLDAGIFKTLWENQHLIPEKWKEQTNGNTTYIFFDETVLRSPGGDRCVLYLFWIDGEWGWSSRWLEVGFSARSPSAVLASSTEVSETQVS